MRVFGVVLVVLMLVPVAGADEAERKIGAAKEKAAAMRREAKELQEAGRNDDARRLREQAEELMAEVEAWAKRTKKKKKKGKKGKAAKEDRRAGILRGLENGIEALQALGRKEDAAHLKEIAADLRRDMKGGDREREVARGYLRVWRAAMKALLDADREEAAEAVEHTIHAMELRLEARRDAEAREVYESAPNAARMTEIMRLAAEILHKKGRKEQAAQVRELAEMHAQQHRRRAGARREPPRERDLEERIAQMERRLAHLTELAEELAREMKRRDR